MNEVQEQVLSFMRNITVPEQSVSLQIINDNVDVEVEESHLDSLRSMGLIECGHNGESYWITSDGLQLVTTSDLDRTLKETNEALRELHRSQIISSATRVMFILGILFLSYAQLVLSSQKPISGDVNFIYIATIILVIFFSLPALWKAIRLRSEDVSSNMKRTTAGAKERIKCLFGK